MASIHHNNVPSVTLRARGSNCNLSFLIATRTKKGECRVIPNKIQTEARAREMNTAAIVRGAAAAAGPARALTGYVLKQSTRHKSYRFISASPLFLFIGENKFKLLFIDRFNRKEKCNKSRPNGNLISIAYHMELRKNT